MRAAFNEAWKLYGFYRQLLARNYCRPVREMVIEKAVLRGYVKMPENAPAFSEACDLWRNCDWRGPARGFVEPVEEIQAIILAIDNGLMTRHEALAERGGDFDEWAEATRAEMKTLSEMDWQPRNKARDARNQENQTQKKIRKIRMTQKITGNEVYRALVPEYADGIFEKMSGNDGLRLAETRSCAESEAAAKITNKTSDVAVISINGPISRDT